MAIIVPSSLVHSIRGKIGNLNYTVWKGVQIAKSFDPTPTQPSPPTDKMIETQGLVSAASDIWKTLSSTNKQLWEVAAKRLFKKDQGASPIGGVRNLCSPNRSRLDGRMLFIGCWCNAYRFSALPLDYDLLEEVWDAMGGWIETGSGLSEINPAGQLHLLPDASNNIARYQDIGSLPEAGYFVVFKDYYDNLGTIASGNKRQFLCFDSEHEIAFDIGADKIRVLNGDAGWDEFALVTLEATWYWWWLVVDSHGHSLKVYRSLDGFNWAYITEFTAFYHEATLDGYVYVHQFRGGAGSSESHQDFIYIGSDLFYPTIPNIHAPVTDHLPTAPTLSDLTYAAGTLTATFAHPPDWDESKHRVGFWGAGGLFVVDQIYRQWLGYQPVVGEHTKEITEVSVTGGVVTPLVSLEPNWMRVQANICDITTGLLSAGSETFYVDIV